MADKARMYAVKFRNGHGEWVEIHAAPSKAALQGNLPINGDVKCVATKHLGWHAVEARPDEHMQGVEFSTKIKGKEVVFSQNSADHSYLVHQLPNQVADTEQQIRSYYED